MRTKRHVSCPSKNASSSIRTSAAGTDSETPSLECLPSPTPTTSSSSEPHSSTDAAAAAATLSRSQHKRERKRKHRRSGGGTSRNPKTWSKPDELAFLRGAISFRLLIGGVPDPDDDMDDFFDYIKKSISPDITPANARNKLRILRTKFIDDGEPPLSASGHDLMVYDLSYKLWGKESQNQLAGGDAEEDGEDDSYQFIREAMTDYYSNGNGRSGQSMVLLEKKLMLVDPSKAKVMERNMRALCEAEMGLSTMRLQLMGEICKMLTKAQAQAGKGSRS